MAITRCVFRGIQGARTLSSTPFHACPGYTGCPPGSFAAWSTRHWSRLLNRPHKLKLHIEPMFNNGVTKDEVKEILLKVACYAGLPAGIDSFRIGRAPFTRDGEREVAGGATCRHFPDRNYRIMAVDEGGVASAFRRAARQRGCGRDARTHGSGGGPG